MKKLNNKGFTLVELLAVIIILAIVVGVSIPAITNIINDSKNNALGVAVDGAEKYITDQHGLMSVNYASASTNFTTKFGTVAADTEVTLTKGTDDALISEMGFSVENVNTVIVKIASNGKTCVKVTEIPKTSEYYTTTHFSDHSTDNNLAIPKTTAEYESKGC